MAAVPPSYLEAVALGVVQGLTEFLPISSTAHLRIVPLLFGWDDPGAAVAESVASARSPGRKGKPLR